MIASIRATQSNRDRDALIENSYEWVRECVRGLTNHWGLSVEDLQDAQEEGVFVVLYALEHFDPARAGSGPNPFRGFVYKVLHDDVIQRSRKREREERHWNHCVNLEALLENQEQQGYRARVPSAYGMTDPAVIVEGREQRARLREVLGGLNPVERFLWKKRAAGWSFSKLPERLGLPEQQLRRLWHRLEPRLRAQLTR